MFDNLDFKFPLMGNLIVNQLNIWMGYSGEKGSKTGLHFDYHDNFYIVMNGRK